MKAAWPSHPDCPSSGCDGSHSGPVRRSTMKNVVISPFYRSGERRETVRKHARECRAAASGTGSLAACLAIDGTDISVVQTRPQARATHGSSS